MLYAPPRFDTKRSPGSNDGDDAVPSPHLAAPTDKDPPTSVFERIVERTVPANVLVVLYRWTARVPPLSWGRRDLDLRSRMSIHCQTLSTILGVVPVVFHHSMPLPVAVVLYVVSTILFFNIYDVLNLVVRNALLVYDLTAGHQDPFLVGGGRADASFEKNSALLRRGKNDAKNKKRSSSRGAVTPISSRNNEQQHDPCTTKTNIDTVRRLGDWATASEVRSRASRVVFLAVICAFVWSLIVVTWFGGLLQLYSPAVENVLYTVTDLLSKNFFVAALGDAALKLHAVEDAIRKVAAIQEAATTNRRHFLRFVMHEVRVPINAVKLGLTQCRHQSLEYLSFVGLHFYFLTVVSCVLEVVIILVETKKI